jgi:hypothetical protein
MWTWTHMPACKINTNFEWDYFLVRKLFCVLHKFNHKVEVLCTVTTAPRSLNVDSCVGLKNSYMMTAKVPHPIWTLSPTVLKEGPKPSAIPETHELLWAYWVTHHRWNTKGFVMWFRFMFACVFLYSMVEMIMTYRCNCLFWAIKCRNIL